MILQFSGKIFWGSYLVIVGILAIIMSYTNVNVSFFRIAAAVLLIYGGVFLLFGGNLQVDPETTFMATVRETVRNSGERNTIFGEGIYDVQPPEDGQNIYLEFNTVFASTTIRVPRDVPVKVEASSAFGVINTPDGSSSFFGERTYVSGETGDTGVIHIRANAVFGSLKITH